MTEKQLGVYCYVFDILNIRPLRMTLRWLEALTPQNRLIYIYLHIYTHIYVYIIEAMKTSS